MRVTFLLDVEQVPGDDPQFGQPWDPLSPSMEHHVVHAVRRLGHEVWVLPFQRDVYATMRRIEESRPDVVFNLVEHHRGDRRVVLHIPALLAMYGVPCTGCGTSGLLMSCDKALTIGLLRDHGLPVPGTVTLSVGEARLPCPLPFPLIVKPRFTEGSEGISLRSIVRTEQALQERVRFVHRRWRQDALCQEYVDGPEISVGVLGNRDLLALPPRETVFGLRDAGGPAIATERVKLSKTYSEKWQVFYRRAELPELLASELTRLASEAYRCLELCGYGRVDFRLTRDGRPVLLEVNANPDLRPRVFGVMASWAGLEYSELVARILLLALERARSPARRIPEPGWPLRKVAACE